MQSSMPPPVSPAGAPPARAKGGPDTGGVNAGFAQLLRGVHGRGAPRRFAAPVQERMPRPDAAVLTEADLEAFLKSLDDTLYPTSLDGDASLRQIWSQFWAARVSAAVRCLLRYIAECPGPDGRPLDPRSDGDVLSALERRIAAAIFVRDRRALRRFVGRRGIDPAMLAVALWTSHAGAWWDLAESPAFSTALGVLLSECRAADAVDHGPRRPELEPRASFVATASKGPGLRPYQAQGRVPSSSKKRSAG